MRSNLWDDVQHPIEDLEDLFRKYMKRQQNMQLSGAGHFHSEFPFQHSDDLDDEECLGLDPFINFQSTIDYLQSTYDKMKNHQHMWNDNGFCWCGWDGNA